MEQSSSVPASGAVQPATSVQEANQQPLEGELPGEGLALAEEGDSGESQDSAEEQIDAAVESGKITKKEAQNLKKKFDIKVDGETQSIELDLSNDEDIKRHLQKAKAFDKRAKEYASLRNTVESLMQELDTDFEGAMKKLGKDPEKMAVEFLKKQVAEMEKSPEQVEREKMQRELEELRTEKKRAEEERQNLEIEKMRNQYATEIENDITNAISGSSLPKGNPRVVKRIAQTMYQVMEMKDAKGEPMYPDVKVQDVIPIVEKEWKEELRSYFDTSQEEMIEELVGKHNLEKLRKKRLAKRPNAPAQTASSIKDTGTKGQAEKDAPKKTYKDFFKD